MPEPTGQKKPHRLPPGPNFEFPHTWEEVSHDGAFWRIFSRAFSHFHLCPVCSAIVKDAKRHLDWHKEQDRN